MTAALCVFYVPCSNETEALQISRQLLEEQLIACGNVIGPMRSIFIWEGKLQEANEVALILKTRLECREKLRTRVVELHSYSCPCVLELATQSVNQPFLEWVRSSVPWETPVSPKPQIKPIESERGPLPSSDDRPPWD